MNNQDTSWIARTLAVVGTIMVVIGIVVVAGGGNGKPRPIYRTTTVTTTTTTEASPPTTSTESSSESGSTSTESEPTPTCHTPAECAAAGAAAAAGEPEPPPTHTTSSAPSSSPQAGSSSNEDGTSVATARTIQPGVQEAGDSGTVGYGEGSCGTEQGQFWKAELRQGETITIIWGGPNDSAMGLDVWPPGTGEVYGSGEGRVTYASTAGEDTETTFTAPSTGVYPIVIDDSCGQPGPFHFTLTRHSAR